MTICLVALCVHMHTLIPEHAFLKRARPAVVRYAFMHPFEHQFGTTPVPGKVQLSAPDGSVEDLTGKGIREDAWYRFSLQPRKRGDYYFLVEARPRVEDGVLLHEGAKVVLHVQSQNGWYRTVRAEKLDILPLTRPYGLVPPAVFQGKVLFGGKPCAGCTLEIEKYNPVPPSRLPEDEFITLTAVTDSNGLFTVSLPDLGWWAVTAVWTAGTEKVGGKELPVKHVFTFWIAVGVK